MDIVKTLSGGDRRSIGRVDEVVLHVLRHKSALPELADALSSEDAVVRMRAADALEKLSARRADWLDPFARDILSIAAASEQKEIRWHAAQILPRLRLGARQRKEAVVLLLRYLKDSSRIVQACALTALVDLAEHDPALRSRVMPIVRRAAEKGAPALKARARKLSGRLGRKTAALAALGEE